MSVDLFADIDWSGVTVNAIFTAFGGAVVFILGWWDRRRKMTRDETKEDEETAIKRYDALYQRQEKDRVECEEKVERLEAKVAELIDKVLALTVTVSRAVQWIRYSSSVMRDHKIPFDPFDPTEKEPPKA